jgi:hypothetical protein
MRIVVYGIITGRTVTVLLCYLVLFTPGVNIICSIGFFFIPGNDSRLFIVIGFPGRKRAFYTDLRYN